jgi:hypothetical protein
MPVSLVFLDGLRHSSEIEDWELRPELTSFWALFFSRADIDGSLIPHGNCVKFL